MKIQGFYHARLAPALFLLAVVLFLPASGLAAVDVVVSIRPLHSLASSIMLGVGEPGLLISAAGSPHGYNLRPSEMRMLQQADLVVWTGPELETFLARPLSASRKEGQARLNLLHDVPELKLLPSREGGRWPSEPHHDENHAGHDAEEHEGHDRHHEHGHDHGDIDPHIWLSPENARIIARAILDRLVEIDPGNRQTYRQNYRQLEKQLHELAAAIDSELKALREIRYIVFHDAYQYFEKSFALSPVGALAVDPDRRPGVRRLSELKAEIRERSVACVFSEPQFEPRLVKTLTEGTTVRVGILDPLGSGMTPGPALYIKLLKDMATSLSSCLGGDE